MKTKLLWLSDAVISTTGFCNQSKNILNRLTALGNYECNSIGHHYLNQPLMPPIKMEEGETINFPVWPGSLTAPYALDRWQYYFEKLKPDIFGILLDSLTENRTLIVKNQNYDVEVLTFKELEERMITGERFKTLGLKYKIGKERRWETNFKGKKYSHLTKKKELIAEWATIQNIASRFVKNHKIFRINQKEGETEVTEEHSLLTLNDNKIEKIKPEEFLKEKRRFLKPRRIVHNRKLRKQDFTDLAIIAGAYLSEGCINRFKRKNNCHNNVVIFSNMNLEWLEKIRNSMQKIFQKNGSYSKSKAVYNLVFYGEELYSWFEKNMGKGSRNKKIPSFIYDLSWNQQKIFLENLIFGDGHFYKTTNKYKKHKKLQKFGYASNSKKLISGLSFLLIQNMIHHTIYYRKDKDAYSLFSSIAKKSLIGKTKVEIKNYTGKIYDITTENGTFLDGIGLIGVHNTFMLYPHMLNINIPTRSVFYFPSDGEFFPENCEHILRRINYPVAMSKFGQQQVKELFSMDVDYIPHGVDCYKHFYPVSDEHKKEIKTAWGLPEDAFIVGGVFRNQGRKNAPAMMKIFGRFFKQLTTEQQSKAFMILNADPLDPAAQADLRRVAQREGINHKVLWTGMKFSHGLTTNQLRELYNIFDINFSSTTGEGFGITTIEGMACKVPALITNYTTTKELVLDHNAGLPIDVNNEIVGTWNVERGFCDYVQGAEQLLTLYKDEGLRKELGSNGRKAVEKYYDWDSVVIPLWDAFFKKVMK